ncbi:MAG TPA: aconitase X [Steroidobacter sp.]|uniref:aconitase X n=1 Tax=Steroidobacter sp. TaxID=1978227 RepID=UPI002ED778EF
MHSQGPASPVLESLSREERRAFDGDLGETQRKLMQTMVLYAEALQADRLVDVQGPGHLVINDSRAGWGARVEFLEELADAGLKAAFPFTIDPPAPYRDSALQLDAVQTKAMDERYVHEDRYQSLLFKLGLKKRHEATCTPWFTQVGNKPGFGQILAWAESSAVVYVNSVLGARTHRNAGVIELISNLVGKTPHAGLLTDEGRRAGHLIRIETSQLPDPQVLGNLIGEAVWDGVPYVAGLDRHLKPIPNSATLQFLHDLGTTCAVAGGVGLFHVENITPEAVQRGRALLRREATELIIDDRACQAIRQRIHSNSSSEQIKPDMCLAGCPHLTLDQLHDWTRRIGEQMQRHGRTRLAVDTILVAAPAVIKAFSHSGEDYQRLTGWGVRLSSFCLEGLMQDRAIAPAAVVTSSNKLRHYNTGVYLFDDEELARIVVTGSASPR